MKGGQSSAALFSYLEGISWGRLVDQQAMRVGRIVLKPAVYKNHDSTL